MFRQTRLLEGDSTSYPHHFSLFKFINYIRILEIERIEVKICKDSILSLHDGSSVILAEHLFSLLFSSLI